MNPTQLSLEDLLPRGQPHGEPMNIGLVNLPTVIEPAPEDLQESIGRFGVLVPVTLVERDYRYTIVDGRRRVAAARALNLETVPAIVYDFAGLAVDVATLVANNLRRPNPVAEYEAIANLIDQGASEAVIVQATRLAPATIKERLRLHRNLLSVFSAGLRAGLISYNLAKAIARQPKARQEELAAIYEEEGRLTQADLDRVRQVATRETVASLPEAMFAGPTVEDLTPRAGGTVTVCVPEELPANPYEGEAFDVLRSLVRYGGERGDRLDPSLAELVARARVVLGL